MKKLLTEKGMSGIIGDDRQGNAETFYKYRRQKLGSV